MVLRQPETAKSRSRHGGHSAGKTRTLQAHNVDRRNVVPKRAPTLPTTPARDGVGAQLSSLWGCRLLQHRGQETTDRRADASGCGEEHESPAFEYLGEVFLEWGS